MTSCHPFLWKGTLAGLLSGDDKDHDRFPADSKRAGWVSTHSAAETSSGSRPYGAKIQRCRFHKAGNVLIKVRKKDRKAVAHNMRQVLYADDRLGAKRALECFRSKWKVIYPDAVRCLEEDFDALVAFLEFPKLEWMHLRTTNIIERMNKQFKRRTKPMEIVAGGNRSIESSPSWR